MVYCALTAGRLLTSKSAAEAAEASEATMAKSRSADEDEERCLNEGIKVGEVYFKIPYNRVEEAVESIYRSERFRVRTSELKFNRMKSLVIENESSVEV